MGVEILFPIVNRATAPIKSVNVDDLSSQLNRTFMFYLSLTFAITITIRQQLGGAIIACDGFSRDEDYERFAEDWCWSKGIYTIKEAYEMQDRASPYPGIIPEDLPACVEFELVSGGKIECPDEKDVKPLTRIYQSWYPFVMFYYWLTALMFFLPYHLYKVLGFDKVKAVVSMLQNPVEDGFEKKELIKRGSVWLYLQSTLSLSHQSLYSYIVVRHSLALCALAIKGMYLCNTVVIYWLTHKMFKLGSFAEYGLLWDPRSQLNNVQSLVQEKLFPKVAACEVKRYGASGMEEDQGMCMLALNVLNQYVFLIFWFCLILVTLVNLLSLILLLTNLFFPTLMLKQFLLSSSLDRSPAVRIISKVYLDSGSSLRFIMDIFARNVDPKLFGEILVQLYSLLADDVTPVAQVLQRRPVKQKKKQPIKKRYLHRVIKTGQPEPECKGQLDENPKKLRLQRTPRIEETSSETITEVPKFSQAMDVLKKRHFLTKQKNFEAEMSELAGETESLLPSTDSCLQSVRSITQRLSDEQAIPDSVQSNVTPEELISPEDAQLVLDDPVQEESATAQETVSEEPVVTEDDSEAATKLEGDVEGHLAQPIRAQYSYHVTYSNESGNCGMPQIPVVMLNDDVLSLRSVSL